MKYSKVGFRAVYHRFCIFPLADAVRGALEGFPGAPAVAWLCRLQERIDGCGIPAGIRQEDVGRYNVRERKKEESL